MTAEAGVYRYLLVARNDFSGWVKAIPMRKIDAKTAGVSRAGLTPPPQQPTRFAHGPLTRTTE